MSDHFGNISISPPPVAKPAAKPAVKPAKKRPVKRPEQPKPSGKKGPAKKYFYILPLLALLPILYSIAGFWLVPLYIAKTLPARLADRTGMRLSFETLDFNPFTFTFSLQGIQLKSARAGVQSPELLSIDKIEADLAPLPLLRTDLVSNALHVDGLNLSIIRGQDNHYNLEELLTPKGPGPSSDIMSFSELPFLFSLNNISIREGKVTFQDTPSASTHSLEHIELDLPALSNFPFQADEYIRPRFSAVINGSKIELTGQAALPGPDGKESLETKLSCNIHALDLPLYSKYLPASLPLTLTKGKADGMLQLNFTRSVKEGAKIAVSFKGQFVDMELVNDNETIVASLPTTSLEGTFLPISGALRFQKIAIHRPHFTAPDTLTPEILIGLAPALARIAAETDGDQVSPPIDIDSLLVEDGDLTLLSNEASKKAASTWNSLQLSIKDFSSLDPAAQPTKPGSFSISGERADSSMTFSWEGELNNGNAVEGPLHLDNIPAATFFAGMGIVPGAVGSGTANMQGKLSLGLTGSGRNRLAAHLSEAEINLQDLTLLSDKSPWLEAPSLKLTGLSKKDSRVDLGQLHLEGGTVVLQSAKLPEIFTGIAAKDSQISLKSIDYSGKIIIHGKTAKPLSLSAVVLQVDNLQSKTETKETLVFSAKVNEKGLIKAKGTAHLLPFRASLSSGFSGIDAQTLLPWYSSLPLLTTAQATLSGKGLLTLPGGNFSGQLRLDNAIFSKGKKPLLSWKNADLQGFSYTRTPFHLGISLMEIDQPVMTWQRTDKDSSPGVQIGYFLQSLLPGQEKSSPPTKDSISISQVDIQDIRLKNGEVHYKDNRLAPPWIGEIRQFGGQLSALHSTIAQERSRFSLSGRLNNLPFSLQGTADFFNKKMAGQSTFKITDFPLSSFRNNLPATLGIDSSKGTFSLDLVSTWKAGGLSHQARYLFDDLSPVAKESDAALALALLKNSDEQIDLKVPSVRNGPEAGPPVLSDAVTAFQRQLIKTKVSPLLLASGDYTDLVGNEFAEFQPGGFILSDRGQKTLSRFSTFLAAHPSIGIRVTGCADRLIDGDALKKQLEEIETKRVDEENVRRKAAWQHERDLELERQRTLQQAVNKQGFSEFDLPTQTLTEYKPLKPEPVIIAESMLLSLAKERATRVQALLTGKLGLAPARIVVVPKARITADVNNPANRATIDLNAFTPAEKEPAFPAAAPR